MNTAKVIGSIHSEEAARLRALARYEIMDSPPDGSFDRITAICARMFDMPIALVTLVDHDRIWFKSRYGLDAAQIDREPGLCASAILSPDIYVVNDAKFDPRTLANPLVSGSMGLRFYAAAPLTTSDGFGLGTLCVIDQRPRSFSAAEQQTLQDLAAVVMDEMELRIAALRSITREAEREREFVAIVGHELRNPLNNLHLSLSVAQEELEAQPEHPSQRWLTKATTYARGLSTLLSELLDVARADQGQMNLKLAPLDLQQLMEELVEQVCLQNPLHSITISGSIRSSVMADPLRLEQVIMNLLTNAVKYAPESRSIEVVLSEDVDNVHVSVADEGVGIPQAQQALIFQRYYRSPGSDKNTQGLGVGLYIAANIITQHHGRIWVENGESKGAVFHFTLPRRPIRRAAP
ncbi:MAG: GAF domain-containing sensor histidine kinase [Flavobacteriales bacterium]